MSTLLEATVARIYSNLSSDHIVGAGFLVSPRHVLTCAHVVAAAAFGTKETPIEIPKQEIVLDFPDSALGQRMRARVVVWLPRNDKPVTQEELEEDIAVLELEHQFTQAQPVNLLSTVDFNDFFNHSYKVFGFPSGKPRGTWTYGQLKEETTGWIQIQGSEETGYEIADGFSGAPVFDKELDVVVGMVVSTERQQPDAKAAFIIPSYTLTKVCSEANDYTRLLPEVLSKVIDEEEIAHAIEKYKDGLIDDLKIGLSSLIKQTDIKDIMTLCFVQEQEEQEVIQKIEKDSDQKIYRYALWALLEEKECEGQIPHTNIVSSIRDLLGEEIFKFYSSYKVRQAIKAVFHKISLEKIKEAVSSLSPNQNSSAEIAIKVKQLIEQYDVLGTSGVLVDRAFREEAKEIINSSILPAILTGIVNIVILIILKLFGATSLTTFFAWLLIVPAAAIGWKIYTFKKNLAKRVSQDVSSQMNQKFNEFNLAMSGNLKALIIRRMTSFEFNVISIPGGEDMPATYNIVILGRAGAGKSSLINYFYGSDIAKTGVGKPVTLKSFERYNIIWKDIPVAIYDSAGLEVGKHEEWMQCLDEELERRGTGQPVSEWFHTIFYCINAASNRVEPFEFKIIKDFLQKHYRVVIVLTHADKMSSEKILELEQCIKQELSATPCVEVCSVEEKLRSGHTSPTFGSFELQEETLRGFWYAITIRLPDRCEFLLHKEIDNWFDKQSSYVERIKVDLTTLFTRDEIRGQFQRDFDAFVENLKANQCEIIEQEVRKTVTHFGEIAKRLNYPSPSDIPDLKGVGYIREEFFDALASFFGSFIDVLLTLLSNLFNLFSDVNGTKLSERMGEMRKDLKQQITAQKPEIQRLIQNMLRSGVNDEFTETKLGESKEG